MQRRLCPNRHRRRTCLAALSELLPAPRRRGPPRHLPLRHSLFDSRSRSFLLHPRHGHLPHPCHLHHYRCPLPRTSATISVGVGTMSSFPDDRPEETRSARRSGSGRGREHRPIGHRPDLGLPTHEKPRSCRFVELPAIFLDAAHSPPCGQPDPGWQRLCKVSGSGRRR